MDVAAQQNLLGTPFSALPEELRLRIIALTGGKTVAQASTVNRAFRAEVRTLRTTPGMVAQLLTATCCSPGVALPFMYVTAGRMHQLETEAQFLSLTSALQAMGAGLVRPLARNPAQQPPRWYESAAEWGHSSVLAVALEAGEPPANAARALHLAARCGQTDAVRLLLQCGAAEGVNWRKLLYAASSEFGGCAETVLAILQQGETWLQLQQFEGLIDLARTALSGLWRCTPAELRRVVDWFLGQPDGPTCCLRCAVEQGNLATVARALAAGADINAVGGAVVEQAVRNGATLTVVLLLLLLQAGAAVTDAQLDELMSHAKGRIADDDAAVLRSLGAGTGLGSEQGMARALSTAARLEDEAALRLYLDGTWGLPPAVLFEAALAAGQQRQWAAVGRLLPHVQPGLSADAHLLTAAAAGDVGGARAASAGGASLPAMEVALALAVRAGSAGAVGALMDSPGWAAQLATPVVHNSLIKLAILTRACGADAVTPSTPSTASVQAILVWLGAAWEHLEWEQRVRAVAAVVNRAVCAGCWRGCGGAATSPGCERCGLVIGWCAERPDDLPYDYRAMVERSTRR